MPELKDIQISVFAFRRQPCRLLQDWLDDLRVRGARIRYASEVRGIDLAREQECNRILDGPGAPRHILMIDADTVPPSDDPHALIEVHGDLLYLGYAGHEGTAGHYGEDDFGCGCCRISARALRRIPKPWFLLPRGHDVLLTCECKHFLARAIAAGLRPRMVGLAWHQQTVYIRPGYPGETSFAWQHELRHCRPDGGLPNPQHKESER